MPRGARGYFALVLHAHLPFVRHPEHARFLEEDWFFEALTECYLPLLDVFETLASERVPYFVTISLSPTLLSMMCDPLLQQRYVRYLDERLAALEGERSRTARQPALRKVVAYYAGQYAQRRRRFIEHDRLDVTRAFRRLMCAGYLEIITCAATHGYLPLLAVNEASLYAQLSMAVRTHMRILGRRPRGIWLPECGYKRGLDRILNEFGLDYFFVESHGLLLAEPHARYGVHRPIRTPGGPAAFGRDYASAQQVWSATDGYPGDPDYRDFYRDVGFDVHARHIERMRHAGERGFTGLKYHRVTGNGARKRLYHPDRAQQRAAAHAEHFLAQRRAQVEWLTSFFNTPPIVVAPYDAELFGHWWYEGPQWMDFLLRAMADDGSTVRTIHPSDYLNRYGELQNCSPPESSWGAGGYHEMWLSEANDWLYPLLHTAAARMQQLVRITPQATGTARRTLDQAARELLLAQASDWAFMMKTGTTAAYATERAKTHLHRFERCARMVESGCYDDAYLVEIEGRDNLFSDIDYRMFQPRPWTSFGADASYLPRYASSR
ncbi:MAG: DUF1957 domain-containing protein [Pseudomonadota bacterium]|nr:MAG: DUF1957 domain-containing protein [Pseudomonadota bacterium]